MIKSDDGIYDIADFDLYDENHIEITKIKQKHNGTILQENKSYAKLEDMPEEIKILLLQERYEKEQHNVL